VGKFAMVCLAGRGEERGHSSLVVGVFLSLNQTAGDQTRVDLIDANDRLHSLRSQLATARCMLTDKTGIQVCSRQAADWGNVPNPASRSVEHPNQPFDIGLN
jgi:hypothetical protein